MTLRAVDGPAGAPWERELAGRLDHLVIESEVLAGNPLGDSARRPLYVYSSPGAGNAARLPAVYLLQAYGGQVDTWMGRAAFEPTLIERLDAMFAAGECPDAVVVLVDAWTSVGGSQFLNSSGTGRYTDYLADEVPALIDQRYPTAGDRDHRALAGKSSGGYGAMVVSMLRPDVFGAFASHAGDALFECCYARDFPGVARTLRDHFDGSFDELLERVREADHFDWARFGAAFSLYAYALAYTPDPDHPGKPKLPFDTRTGRLRDDVWQQWLAFDPVRMAAQHAVALRSMRRIYLDAGRSDEYYLDLGAEAFAAELDAIGALYTLELFDGRHGGTSHRYPRAIRELIVALTD
jgi:hypothetical protein